MSKEAKAFLDGMAAMWAWQALSGGMRTNVLRVKWESFANEICEDATERAELERVVAERFPR